MFGWTAIWQRLSSRWILSWHHFVADNDLCRPMWGISTKGTEIAFCNLLLLDTWLSCVDMAHPNNPEPPRLPRRCRHVSLTWLAAGGLVECKPREKPWIRWREVPCSVSAEYLSHTGFRLFHAGPGQGTKTRISAGDARSAGGTGKTKGFGMKSSWIKHRGAYAQGKGSDCSYRVIPPGPFASHDASILSFGSGLRFFSGRHFAGEHCHLLAGLSEVWPGASSLASRARAELPTQVRESSGWMSCYPGAGTATVQRWHNRFRTLGYLWHLVTRGSIEVSPIHRCRLAGWLSNVIQWNTLLVHWSVTRCALVSAKDGAGVH